VLADFVVESLRQRDDISLPALFWLLGVAISEPQAHVFKEVKTRAINEAAAAWLVFPAEEDRGGKNPLEAFDNAPVMAAVFREMEKIEHLSRGLKVHNVALLLECPCGNPDGDQPILTVGQAKAGLTGNFEKELAVPPEIGELVSWRWPERDAAENERAGIV
jgi:hypothetical protein